MTIDRSRIKAICEALIFVSDEALSFRKISSILEGMPAPELRGILEELVQEWNGRASGFVLAEVAEGYQFRTRPENVEWVKMLVQFKPTRLSRAALETLAIIAYNQPASKSDIEGIRGVDCTSSVSQLLEKGMIRIVGRREGPGRPFLYGTTREFLEIMGMKDLSELPSLKEIEEADVFKGGEEGEDAPCEESSAELDELERSGSPENPEPEDGERSEEKETREEFEEPDEEDDESDAEEDPEDWEEE